MLNRNRTPPPW